MRRVIAIALVLGALGAGVGGYLQHRSSSAGQGSAAAGEGGGAKGKGGRRGGFDGPIPVVLAEVGRRDVPIYLDGLGSVQAFNTVTVRPQVSGQLLSVAFSEGQTVRAGDLLAQIDPRSFEAQVQQALAPQAPPWVGGGAGVDPHGPPPALQPLHPAAPVGGPYGPPPGSYYPGAVDAAAKTGNLSGRFKHVDQRKAAGPDLLRIGVGGIAGDGQDLGPSPSQPKSHLTQDRTGLGEWVVAVRHLGIDVHQGADVVLVLLGRGVGLDAGQELQRRGGPHPAQHAEHQLVVRAHPSWPSSSV